jgi:hypothetical protein
MLVHPKPKADALAAIPNRQFWTAKMKTGEEESVVGSVKNVAKRRDEPRMEKQDRLRNLKDWISLTSLMSQAFMAKDVSAVFLSFILAIR